MEIKRNFKRRISSVAYTIQAGYKYSFGFLWQALTWRLSRFEGTIRLGQDFFRFLQLRHRIHEIFNEEDLDKIQKSFFISSDRADLGLRTISKPCNGLWEWRRANPSYIKEKWESNVVLLSTVQPHDLQLLESETAWKQDLKLDTNV